MVLLTPYRALLLWKTCLRDQQLPLGVDPPHPTSVPFIQATIFDNSALLRVNPGYLATIISLFHFAGNSNCKSPILLQGIKPAHQGSFSPDQGRRKGSNQSAEDQRLDIAVGAQRGGSPAGEGHTRSKSPRKGPLRYCRPGVLGANPARRNAAAIASPLVDAADRRRFSDPVAAISADVLAGRASRA